MPHEVKLEKLTESLPGVEGSKADLRPELQALIVELLQAVPRLATKLAGEVRLSDAVSVPILRVRRTARLEVRCVVARQEPYAQQPLSRSGRQHARRIDVWADRHTMERPDELNPVRELRLEGSERRIDCRECEGRGRNACAVCGPASAASCPACGGQGLVACTRCRETGEQIEYLVLESRHRVFTTAATRPLGDLAYGPGASDIDHASGTPLLRIAALGHRIERAPELPWPQVKEDVEAAIPWLVLPTGAVCHEDTIALDVLVALKAEWELEDRRGRIETVRDAAFRQADPGLADALRARAAKLLGSPGEWLSQPEWMASLALEALDWPGAGSVHEAALSRAHALARELIESGRLGPMAELRPIFARIAEHPSATAWRTRFASLLASHHRRCAARFRMLLDTNGLLEDVRIALDEALDSTGSRADVSALHERAMARLSDLVKSGDSEGVDALAEALGRARWPSRQLADEIGALRPEALEDRAKEIEEGLDSGADLETAFADTIGLAAKGPWLPKLERLARAFRQRLRDETNAGNVAEVTKLAQRLRNGFERTRPDLATLFADLAGDRRDGLAINLRTALARPGGLPVAVDMLLLAGVDIADEAVAREVARALDRALAQQLEREWLPQAECGEVSAQTELELTRALGAWLRLQQRFPAATSVATFPDALWRFLERMLGGTSYRRAQALCELAEPLDCVRAHASGSVLAQVREKQLVVRGAAALGSLESDSDPKDALALAKLLARLMPHHPLTARLADEMRRRR